MLMLPNVESLYPPRVRPTEGYPGALPNNQAAIKTTAHGSIGQVNLGKMAAADWLGFAEKKGRFQRLASDSAGFESRAGGLASPLLLLPCRTQEMNEKASR